MLKEDKTEDDRFIVEEKQNALSKLDEAENYDEETLMEAQRFCLKYEDEIALLPLCQIAYYIYQYIFLSNSYQ